MSRPVTGLGHLVAPLAELTAGERPAWVSPATWAYLGRAAAGLAADAADVRERLGRAGAAEVIGIGEATVGRWPRPVDATPRYVRVAALTAADIDAMRAWWRGGPPRWEQGRTPDERTPVKRLRFVRAGEMVDAGGQWHRLVAQAVAGTLPEGVAPCLPTGGSGPAEVRSVQLAELGWGALEEREWRALRAMGLTAEQRAELEALGSVDAGDL